MVLLRNFSAIAVVSILWAFSSAAATAQELAYDPPELNPERGFTSFAVPRAAQPPDIDGSIDTEEWAHAVKFNVMADQRQRWASLFPRWATWWMMWDDDNLYLAGRSQRLPNENLVVRFRDETLGGNTVFDDSIEIHFCPFGRNKAGRSLPWAAQAIINPLGVGHYEKYIWQVAARNTAWNPGWNIGSQIHDDYWDIEIAISRESMELFEPNKAGDPWSILLARNWKRTGWHQSAIPSNISDFKTHPAQPAIFLHDGAYAQLEDVSGLFDGRIYTQLKIGNSGKNDEKVTVEFLIEEDGSAEDRRRFADTRELDVPVGRVLSWTIDRPNQLEEGKTYRYHLRVSAEGSEYPLLETYFRVAPGSHKWLEERAARLTAQQYSFKAGFAPTALKLRVDADFLYAPDPDAIAKLNVKLFNGDEMVFEQQTGNIHARAISDVLELPELEPATYRWEMELVDKAGEIVARQEGTIEKRNEVEEYEWWNFEGARVDKVLWPYEPIEIEPGVAKYWGGELHLDGLSLPRQVVVTANREWRPVSLEGRPSVLAKGAVISARKDGKPAGVVLQGQPRTTGVEDWQAGLTGFGRIGNDIEIQSGALFSQDGLLWINMTLRPGIDTSSGKDVRRASATLDELTIDIPYRPEVAELLVSYGTPGLGVAMGAVPEGDGVVWNNTDIGRSVLTVGNMLPFVWMGNDQRGLAFFAENNIGWEHAGKPDQQIIRENGQVILRLNIIQQPVTLEGDRTISFGLMPTPMRKMVSGWRMMNCNFSQNFVNWFGTGVTAVQGAHSAAVIPASYQKNREVMFRNTKNIITRLGGFEFAPHTEQGSYQTRSNDADARGYFGPEWEFNTWTQSFQNHLLWNMQKYIGQGGLTGIYHDQHAPYPMTNTTTGAAYTLDDGRVNRGYNLLKSRQLVMREHALFYENNITPRVFTHCTDGGDTITYPWVTAVLDGEANWISANSENDWIDAYSPERMQAHGNPWPFGNTFYWMILMEQGEPDWNARQIRTFLGWQILHDVIDPLERAPGNAVRQSMFDWGMNDDRVKFWPYWRNAEFVHVDQQQVLASMWTLPDRVMLCAVNLDRKRALNTTIRVPLHDLGLAPKIRAEYVTATDALNEGDVGLDAWNGEVRFSVKPRDFRLVSIRRYAN